jgi:uroporphyrinogen-III decarboxylase
MGEKSRVGVLENAPPWWPNFKPPEFTEEDLCEFERYCMKIVENVQKEKGMTPWERWKTTLEWGIPDRPVVRSLTFCNTVGRALDCWSDSLKPGIDMWWYPKLALKAHFAWNARFNVDAMYYNVITYGETEYGGRSRAKLVPYAAPAVIDPPIKTEEDWENVHVPDLNRDGYYPVYLWIVRKSKEFFKKYGISDLMPISAAFCGHPTDQAIVLYGMKKYLLFWKRNPEILHKCAQFDLPFKIQYAKALLEAGADQLMLCSMGAPGGVEAFKPFTKYWLEIHKALTPPGVEHALGFANPQTFEYMCETGCIGIGFYYSSTEAPTEPIVKIARKYKKYFSPLIDFLITALGPPQRIIDAVKENINMCAGPGYVFYHPPMDYWTPLENYDLAIRTAKEYGREVYKNLQK